MKQSLTILNIFWWYTITASCVLCLTSQPVFIPSIKINIFIIQLYAVKFFPSLGFLIFHGKLFNTQGKAIEVELYQSAFPMWCSRNNVQWNYSVSSPWEAKLNTLRFQSVFDICSFFCQSQHLHSLFYSLLHVYLEKKYTLSRIISK